MVIVYVVAIPFPNARLGPRLRLKIFDFPYPLWCKLKLTKFFCLSIAHISPTFPGKVFTGVLPAARYQQPHFNV